MKYLLDTNTCIRHLNQRSESVIQKLNSLLPDEIAVCSAVKAELYYGAAHSNQPRRTRAKQDMFLKQFVSLSFDDRAANEYGRIRAQLADRGTPIGPNGLMIVAIAVVNDLRLVTHNTAEFRRVDGLAIEDWEA